VGTPSFEGSRSFAGERGERSCGSACLPAQRLAASRTQRSGRLQRVPPLATPGSARCLLEHEHPATGSAARAAAPGRPSRPITIAAPAGSPCRCAPSAAIAIAPAGSRPKAALWRQRPHPRSVRSAARLPNAPVGIRKDRAT
jgi:hypothetical protein